MTKQRQTEAARGKPWTEAEQLAAVFAYGAMLARLAEGQAGDAPELNKAAIIRVLRGEPKTADKFQRLPGLHQYRKEHGPISGKLAARSRASVEAKFMNISAARRDLGLSVLPGYKPAGNYQKSLTDAIQSAERAAA